jgi:hypothetical protein
VLHRVGRAASFFSSRRNRDAPNPPPAGECAPPFGSGGRDTLAGERGGGRVPIPTRGHTLWYSIKIYVLCAVLPTFMFRRKALTKKSFCWSSEAWLLQPGSGHLHQQQAGEDHGSEIFSIALNQCCGSMTFWCGSGSGTADPCLC